MLRVNLRVKLKQRISLRSPEKLATSNKSDEYWPMNLMRDHSCTQRRFRTFKMIDDFNYAVLGIDMAVNLPEICSLIRLYHMV